MSGDYTAEDLKKMVEIALVCTQSPPSSRPTMSEILVMLMSRGEQNAPIRGSFSYGGRVLAGHDQTTSDSTGLSSNSNATASFTQFTGR